MQRLQRFLQEQTEISMKGQRWRVSIVFLLLCLQLMFIGGIIF